MDPSISSMYLHFGSDGTYILESSSCPCGDTSSVAEPIFVYGTFSSVGDAVVLRSEYAIDNNGLLIADSNIDECWVHSPSVDHVTISDVFVRENTSTAIEELTFRDGTEVSYEPLYCDGNITLQDEMIWGYKHSNTPGDLVLK